MEILLTYCQSSQNLQTLQNTTYLINGINYDGIYYYLWLLYFKFILVREI